MKRMLIAVAAAFALLAAGTAAAKDAPKGKVTLQQKDAAAAKKGPVTFDHGSAMHKTLKCDTCHASAEGGKLELDMKTGHASCQKCHLDTAKADAAKKALGSCDNCHAKK
jgi:opacity protein-like surface antigen